MVWLGGCYTVCLSNLILMVFQAGVASKWTNDGQWFLLEHFDTIHNSPSHIYHSALPLSPSWFYKHYSAELSPMINVVKGLPAEWGMCSRTVALDSDTPTLSYHDKSIAVGSSTGDIIILDTITGTQKAILSGHTMRVSCVAFSIDGSSLVSGGGDETVKLWDVQTGGVIKTFSGHTDCVRSVSVSADHTTVASGSDGNAIHLWDIKTGRCLHTIRQQGIVLHVMFSPTDPQHLISISGKKVWQWDANGHQIKPPFDGNHVSFSSDGAQFVSCFKQTITVHNSSSGAIVAKFQITGSTAHQCSFSPNGRLVAVATHRTAYCWNVISSKPHLVETFIGHTANITSLVFSSPTILISASRDNSVKFWQIRAQSTDPTVIDPKSTPLPSASIMSITLQAKDEIVITSDSDRMVKTWDILTGIHKASFQTPAKDYRRDVRLINDRLILVWYPGNGTIYVWDAGNEKLLLEVGEVQGYAGSLIRISEDGSKFYCLYLGFIQAWYIQTGEVVGKCQNPF